MVTALIFTIIAACTKHEIERQPLQKIAQHAEDKLQPSIFVSEWEAMHSWATQKSGDVTLFSYSRHFPQLNESSLINGAVLVFARNIWADDPSLKELDNEPDKPLMMPFYFLPYFEKPDYTEKWDYKIDAANINVSLMVKGSSDASMPGKKIELQYVIIPEQVLKEKEQTVKDVRQLSYEEVMKTFAADL